jgi:hypothetical protein
MAKETARTTSGSGQTIKAPQHNRAIFLFEQKVNDLVVGDTIDMHIEGSFDGGTTWYEIAAFDQATGTATIATDAYMLVPFSTAEVNDMQAAVGGTARSILAPLYRATWAIAGVSPSFDFNVYVAFFQ